LKIPFDTRAQRFGISGECCAGWILVQPDLELVDGGSVDAGALGNFGEAQSLPFALRSQIDDQLLDRPVAPSSGTEARGLLVSRQVDLTAFVQFPLAGPAPSRC